MLKSFVQRTFQKDVRKRRQAALRQVDDTSRRPDAVTQAVQLKVRETEETFYLGAPSHAREERTRLEYDRTERIARVLKAYRTNPLCRRLVKLPRLFALGNRLEVEYAPGDKRTVELLNRFWKFPLNALDEQIPEWFDERTLTGDLFLLFSADLGGFPLVRAVPSESITRIETAENDYRQELLYFRGALDQDPYPAFQPGGPLPAIRHYPLNRLAGVNFGESDLFPELEWITLYDEWLKHRAALNHYRSLFVWDVSGNYTTPEERRKRQREIAMHPPSSASVMVHNNDETWEAKAPNLDSADAANDGLALKKNVAAGMGIPLHFLAEPESSTRTTAEAAGTPTYKTFEEYQSSFFNILRDVLRTAAQIYRRVDRRIDPEIEIDLHGADISERDNAALAIAFQSITQSAGELFDRRLIDSKEYLRLVYKFAGEVLDESQAIPEGYRRPVSAKSTPPTQPTKLKPSVDTLTGDVNNPIEKV